MTDRQTIRIQAVIIAAVAVLSGGALAAYYSHSNPAEAGQKLKSPSSPVYAPIPEPPLTTANTVGFKPLAGHCYQGTEVYIQGKAGYDNDPPQLAFTIVDPLVYLGDGEGTRWMKVTYPDGSSDYIGRDSAVFSDLYWVQR